MYQKYQGYWCDRLELYKPLTVLVFIRCGTIIPVHYFQHLSSCAIATWDLSWTSTSSFGTSKALFLPELLLILWGLSLTSPLVHSNIIMAQKQIKKKKILYLVHNTKGINHSASQKNKPMHFHSSWGYI